MSEQHGARSARVRSVVAGVLTVNAIVNSADTQNQNDQEEVAQRLERPKARRLRNIEVLPRRQQRHAQHQQREQPQRRPEERQHNNGNQDDCGEDALHERFPLS